MGEISFTTTLTSKGQITVPVQICRKLGLERGMKVDVYAFGRDGFEATVRRRSRILEFAGDLKDFDKKGRHQQMSSVKEGDG